MENTHQRDSRRRRVPLSLKKIVANSCSVDDSLWVQQTLLGGKDMPFVAAGPPQASLHDPPPTSPFSPQLFFFF